MAWLGKHGSDVTRPPLDAVIAALKEQGITSFAATGYCFGGVYSFIIIPSPRANGNS